MGNTFHFSFGRFHEHVVETDVLVGTETQVRKVGFPGPPKHVAIVSIVRLESQERLQMEGSIRSPRAWWAARPDAPSEAFAGTNLAAVAQTDSSFASTTLELGKPQTCRSIAPAISATRGSVRADDRQVAPADEIESRLSAAVQARAASGAQAIDLGRPE